MVKDLPGNFKISNFNLIRPAAILLLISQACLASPLVQNPHSRAGFSLDGQWARIIDPCQNGYYNYHFEPHEEGNFSNRKQQHPAELVEYDFASSPRLAVPGDWNSQEKELFFYAGRHEGGFTPFQFDLTGQLEDGEKKAAWYLLRDYYKSRAETQ